MVNITHLVATDILKLPLQLTSNLKNSLRQVTCLPMTGFC